MVDGMEKALEKAQYDVGRLQTILSLADDHKYGPRSSTYAVGLALRMKRDSIMPQGYSRELYNRVDGWLRRVRTNPDAVEGAMEWEPSNDANLEKLMGDILRLQQTYVAVSKGHYRQDDIVFACETALGQRTEDLKRAAAGDRTHYNKARQWIGDRAARHLKRAPAQAYRMELQPAV